MKFFEGIDEFDEPKVSEAKEIDRPDLKESAIPRWTPSDKIDDTKSGDLSDLYDLVLKSFGLTSEMNSEESSEAKADSEDKDYPQYLEKNEGGNYCDKETDKIYDSIESWEKAQETLAKRYEGTAEYYEEKAKKEYAQYRDSEQNGESIEEARGHYLNSQEYCAKAKECKEKAEHVREKVGHAENQSEEDIEKNNEANDKKDVSDSPEKRNPIQNKVEGSRREKEVLDDLMEKYSPEEGYKILREVYLRDKDGNIVKDPKTGEARRIDFVVVKDGKVVDSVEVTSKTADKSDQTAKENRIRENGGNYIRDNNGNLIKIPSDVRTRVERRD